MPCNPEGMHILCGEALVRSRLLLFRSTYSFEAVRPAAPTRRSLSVQATNSKGGLPIPRDGESFKNSILQPRIKALLVDAAGTLISPSEPVAEVCLRRRPFASYYRTLINY